MGYTNAQALARDSLCHTEILSMEKMPAQKQTLPGSEQKMDPKPISDNPNYKGSGRLKDKVALITGGDSGIGKAVAILFAKEGAKLAVCYFNGDEEEDAFETLGIIEKYGGDAILIRGDIADPALCKHQCSSERSKNTDDWTF